MDNFFLDLHNFNTEDRHKIKASTPKVNIEEHKDDTQIKKGLWKSCNGEIFVNLASNKLKKFLWQDYKDFNNLVYIYLNNNELREIDGKMFLTFPNLYWLDLRENQLSLFPKEVKNHPKLNTILLDNNKIREIPIELGSLEELKGLSVFNNPIKVPTEELLQLRQNQLINYLRKCWKLQCHDLPVHEQPIPEEKKKISKFPKTKRFKPIEEIGDFVTRNWKSCDTMDQILADTLVKNIEAQNDILQKRKDFEYLKEWRERYSASKLVPVSKTLNAPPFGTYEQFSKMPNRRDVNANLNIKLRPKLSKPKRKRHEYLTTELKKIQETMDNIRSAHPITNDIHEKSINEAMAVRIKDIKALRDIQKRINELRLQT